MKKQTAAAVATCIALAGFGVLSPVAHAASSNVNGWTPGTVTCANGAVSVFPIVVANGSDANRTGSYTVPSFISSAVQVASSPSGINCQGTTYEGRNHSANFAVPAGGVTVLWVGLGTTGQTSVDSHNIGFGGMPSGARGASYYDLGLTLNNATTAINGGNTFNNLTATYQGTGGTDPRTNNQDGFVITGCTKTDDGSILPGSGILTPYNAGAWTSGPVYTANQPLCAAWAPEGAYVGYTQGTSSQFTTLAAQTYGGGAMLAVAGSGSAPITSAYYVSNLFAPVSINLPINAPQAGAWLGQDPQTGEWFIANIQQWQGSSPVSTSLYLNGQLVGTVG